MFANIKRFFFFTDTYDLDDSNYYNEDEEDNEYNYETNPHVSYANYKKKILKEFNDDDF